MHVLTGVLITCFDQCVCLCSVPSAVFGTHRSSPGQSMEMSAISGEPQAVTMVTRAVINTYQSLKAPTKNPGRNSVYGHFILKTGIFVLVLEFDCSGVSGRLYTYHGGKVDFTREIWLTLPWS